MWAWVESCLSSVSDIKNAPRAGVRVRLFHLISQLTLSELAPYLRKVKVKSQKVKVNIAIAPLLLFAFYLLPCLRGLPGFHRAGPSTPLDEQFFNYSAQYTRPRAGC